MNLKKNVALLLFTATMLSHASAQSKDGFGLGIIIGEPTGLSVKHWPAHDRAIDAGIAWSFSGYDALHFHADYLLHKFGVLTSLNPRGRFALYFGIGGRIKLREDQGDRGWNDDHVLLGLRGPVGISYVIAEAPIDLFLEIVPVLDLVPDTDFDLNAAIGARFYF